MTLDGTQYEREQRDSARQVAALLLAAPEFNRHVDAFGSAPVVALLCGRGHRLLHVRGTVEEGDIRLEPLPDHLERATGGVTSHAEPWSEGRTVCDSPGCPATVARRGYCSQHGGPLEVIGAVRTGFTCRRRGCDWSEPLTSTRLLKLYGTAVTLGWTEMPLNFDARRRT